MDFGWKWRRWIKGCLESSRASVLVNGSPTKEFDIKMGVRQDDSLSPFLFIIVMEGLYIFMEATCNLHYFHELSLPSNGISNHNIFI